jgi:tetratricopeptide (TPR) repeat protein
MLLIASSSNEDARKANKAYEEGDYQQAEILYRTALEADPDNAHIYFNLGNTLAKQGKVEEAIQAYMEFESKATTADEKSLAEYNIGTLLSENEQWKPAVQHLKNALRYNPADSDSRHNFERALAESQKQDEEQQQNQDQQNQDIPPPTDYAKAMKKRAEQLVAEKKYGEAFNLMQQALQADETVQNFNDFINRIGAVYEIDS